MDGKNLKTKKLTANLIVESVEDALGFWVDRIGFEKTVEVPHEGRVGFVILVRGAVELMLQSRASLAADVPALAAGPHRAVLYLEVDDLAPVRATLAGWPGSVVERKTFYGAHELVLDDVHGHAVFFSRHG